MYVCMYVCTYGSNDGEQYAIAGFSRMKFPKLLTSNARERVC